jgi:hypothetical protein
MKGVFFTRQARVSYKGDVQQSGNYRDEIINHLDEIINTENAISTEEPSPS